MEWHSLSFEAALPTSRSLPRSLPIPAHGIPTSATYHSSDEVMLPQTRFTFFARDPGLTSPAAGVCSDVINLKACHPITVATAQRDTHA